MSIAKDRTEVIKLLLADGFNPTGKGAGSEALGRFEEKYGAAETYKLLQSPRLMEYNKGGEVNTNKQMKMAFMQEGGEVERDPVSGNEVPTGSFPEEVRDDVPAMLSEGEYVVPADVLRFYGLKFFEDLRDKAKMSLAKMEQNGRIGGEPMSPSIPDAPTVVNKGGVIEANNGTMVGGTMTAEQMAAQQAAQVASTVAPTYTANVQQPSSAAFQAAVSAPMGGASATGTSGMGRTAMFVNPTGLTMQILVNDKGEPLYGAPPGYVLATSDEGKKRLGDTGVTTAPEAVKAETPKKKEKSGKDAFEKAKKSREDAIAAENRAIERLGIGDRADEYRELSLTQRLSLGVIEGKKMLNPDYVITSDERDKINEVLDNPAEAPELLDLIRNPLLFITGGSKKTDTEVPATSAAFKGKIAEKDKPYTTQRETKDDKGNTYYVDTVDLDKKAKDDPNFFGTGKSEVYRDSEGNVSFDTPEAIKAAEDEFKKDPLSVGNKGMLVTKPKRKPRAKRKSLGQK